MMIHAFLNKTMRSGRLSVTYPGGKTEAYGDGSGPPVAVRLSKGGVRRLTLNPSLGLGEA